MEKSVVIHSKEELVYLQMKVMNNLQMCLSSLKLLVESCDALTLFQRMKFEKIATEPLTGEPENLLEVVNQYHTYLVSIKGAEFLLEKYPDTVFRINFGNISGYDIESDDGNIIAECFAATSYRSNGKLNADLKRLMDNEQAEHKYEFFFDKEFAEKNQKYYQEKYSDIIIIKFQEI